MSQNTMLAQQGIVAYDNTSPPKENCSIGNGIPIWKTTNAMGTIFTLVAKRV